MTREERLAEIPVAAIVDRFMGTGPAPGESAAQWAASRQEVRDAIIAALVSQERPGSDPRDYKTEPGLWRSQLLPLGVTIDQAIKDGVW